MNTEWATLEGDGRSFEDAARARWPDGLAEEHTERG